MKITKSAVDKICYARASNAADYRWDDNLKGFGVRVYPTGKRVFVITYRNENGQKRFHTLGQYGVLTVDQARRLAKEKLADVLHGNDPQADRRAKRVAPTIGHLCDQYLSQHAEAHKAASSLKQDKRIIETRIRPKFGRIPVAALGRADVDSFHKSMRDTPYEANRVLALLSKMMNLAEKWEYRPDGSNPVRLVERFKEQKRERFLSDNEFARLGEALAEAEASDTENPLAIAAIRLLVFTGCRLSEILTLRWAYVDIERAEIAFPASKTGAKRIPIAPPALELLISLPRIADNPYVLPGRNQGEPVRNIQHAWSRIKSNAGLDDVRLHDLRHSFASVGASSGLSLPIIGKMLGHTQASTTQRYAHLADDPLRKAAESVGNRIAATMAKRKTGSVVPIKR